MKDEDYVYLVNLLNLRAKEYKKLCGRLESLKKHGVDSNSEEYLKLEKGFQKNQGQIIEIKKQMEKFNRQ